MPTTRSEVSDIDAIAQKVVEKLIDSDLLIEKLTSIINTSLKAEFSKIVEQYELKISSLETQLGKTKAEMEDSLDALEQYTRLNSLRIFGVPEKPNENTNDLVRTLCEEKLNIIVTNEDIDISHRIGSREAKHRPIIVKFVRRDVKKKVYNNKKKLKNSPIVIREDLSKRRMVWLKSAVQKFGSKKVWTSDGKIFVKTGSGIKIMKSYKDVQMFNNEIL